MCFNNSDKQLWKSENAWVFKDNPPFIVLLTLHLSFTPLLTLLRWFQNHVEKEQHAFNPQMLDLNIYVTVCVSAVQLVLS